MENNLTNDVIKACGRLTYPHGPVAGEKIRLLPHEEAFVRGLLADDVDVGALTMPRGNNKALALDTPLPAPNGWTNMERVQVGDLLYGSQGQVVKVEAKSKVFLGNQCYRVSFDDGSSIVADAEHVWTVWDRTVDIRRKGHPRIHGAYRNLTTEQMSNRKPLSDGHGGYMNPYAIDVCKPLHGFNMLPIPPYTLGAWLGDGTSKSGAITTMDQQVLDIIRQDGYRISGPLKGSERCGKANMHTICGLQTQLRKLGVLKNKHIPDQYLRAPVSERLELLRGLMDTDGCFNEITRTSVYCTTSVPLAEGFVELLRSLGVKTRLPRPTSTIGKDAYVFVFFPPWDMNPFNLTRKSLKYGPRANNRGERARQSQRHTIVSIEQVPSVATQCIRVDSEDSLYLAGESMIPTHNTGLLATIAAMTILRGGPLVRQGTHVVIVAASIDQGSSAFDDIVHHLETWHDGKTTGYRIVNSDTQKSIHNAKDRVRLRVAGSSPNFMHGKRVSFALLDEPAQWEPNRTERMYNAVYTSLGKSEGAKICAIGTQSENPNMWFQRLLDTEDPSVFSMSYVADMDADPAEESTWMECNPLAHYSETLHKRIANEAAYLDNETAMAAFRALRLNLGNPEVVPGESLIDYSEWLALKDHDVKPDGGYVLGIDLGRNNAMSAATAVFGSGYIDTLVSFGNSKSIGERAHEDGVGDLYAQAQASGSLYMCVYPIPHVGTLIAKAIRRWGEPEVVIADPLRKNELEVAVKAYCGRAKLMIRHSPLESHADIDFFRESVRSGELFPANIPLMDHGIKGARVKVNESGQYKLARSVEAGRKATHKDDAIAALIPAAATRYRMLTSPETAYVCSPI